ncbi:MULTISPECIES: hypothetical protein [Gracilibacillus]|uniref:Uncharacterized protein n=1 Tax=Gracilibacillus dipsosauri TaxID=178340 RepID=A0A317L7P9_9BACI|nr:hypothetical protein [Gracilibacillus dipsosauri]PWU69809.1 hypothetical protein DLJ74_02435 [Gracilibacillus dipsosauri]
MNKKEIPEELKERLEEFHVEIPQIPLKKNKLDQLADWICKPVKSPLEFLSIHEKSTIKLGLYPLFAIFILLLPTMFLI